MENYKIMGQLPDLEYGCSANASERCESENCWECSFSYIKERKEEIQVDYSPCECGNVLFKHRHSNWIECTKCNKIRIL